MRTRFNSKHFISSNSRELTIFHTIVQCHQKRIMEDVLPELNGAKV